MFDWLGGAWDSFTGLFGGDDNSLSSSQNSLLQEMDINTDSSIGGMPISDYSSSGFAPDLTNIGSNDGYNSILGDYDFGSGKVTKVNNPKIDDPWYTNPNVLGSAITAGAGLFSNMSALDAKKAEEKSQREAMKMNNLLELTKLKHQILQKQATGSGGARRSGGSSAESTARQNSVNTINQLNNLGSSLSNIYKG